MGTQSLKVIEATISSKGQVTLPKKLRDKLGLHKGSRIRFSISDHAPVTIESIRYDLEDLWRMADQGPEPDPMSFEEMNEAKTRREW